MPPGTNLDNVVRSISSKQIPEDSRSPVTTFEVPVSIPDPPVTTCEAPVGPTPPEKRPRTWEDMAAAAGVLIMTSADNEEPDLEPMQKKKKMTPKEYRQMKPKPKTNPSITLLDKNNFKEGFNTDKSRLIFAFIRDSNALLKSFLSLDCSAEVSMKNLKASVLICSSDRFPLLHVSVYHSTASPIVVGPGLLSMPCWRRRALLTMLNENTSWR